MNLVTSKACYVSDVGRHRACFQCTGQHWKLILTFGTMFLYILSREISISSLVSAISASSIGRRRSISGWSHISRMVNHVVGPATWTVHVSWLSQGGYYSCAVLFLQFPVSRPPYWKYQLSVKNINDVIRCPFHLATNSISGKLLPFLVPE